MPTCTFTHTFLILVISLKINLTVIIANRPYDPLVDSEFFDENNLKIE